MHRLIYKLYLAAAFILIPTLSSISTNAQEPLLLQDFKVSLEGDSNQIIEVTVPGALQADLIRLGLIPDHFIGGNEDSVQWVSDQNWLYTTTFTLEEEDVSSALDYVLHLEWVDTYSEVYLNGAKIGDTNNLFRTYHFNVGDYVRSGENRLLIRFLSPTKIAHAQYLSNGFNYPADNDRNDIKYSPFVRKSPYHFGWDWGPRMITFGLGAPVVLKQITGPTHGSLYVRNHILWEGSSAKVAKVTIESELLHHDLIQEPRGELTLTLLSPEGEVLNTSRSFSAKELTCPIEYTFEVPSPELWMPNGWGEQPLYSLVRSYNQGEYHTSDTTHFGIREVRLDRTKDEAGQSFTFIVNNRPLYVKGANYLPHDRRFGGGGKSLEELFRDDIVPAHFNMLRVWGGGTYETEEFYNLADKYGILIWQDFPFACSTYPNDPTFRENVAEEAKDQLTRIRNHPSIAFFCGNNEVLEGLKHWGWKRKYGYSDEVWEKMFEDYDEFFRGLLPDLVETYAPHVQYMHGSPYDSNWGIPESFLSSDSHNWRVWFGGKDFTEFDINPGRFASEFGFQSFPEMKTIQSFAPGYDIDTLTIESPILKHRQRSFIGNQRITDYMERSYPVPTSFSDYVYVGQLLHGRGMGYALRAIRRAYPLNMGSLYWQLNDVWPTVSWSSIDYWGNYKALHYEVEQAYAPYVVDIVELEENLLSLWVVSDNIYHEGELLIELVGKDFNGIELMEKSYRLHPQEVPFSTKIAEEVKAELPSQQMFISITLTNIEGTILAQQTYYPSKPKGLQLKDVLPIVERYDASDGKLSITLSSPTLIYGLFVETPWQGATYSDNYFDLLPHESKTITIIHKDINQHTQADELAFWTLNRILSKYE